MDPADRVILVTGAASGIGLATAVRLAPTCSRLVLVDRDVAALSRVELPCPLDRLSGDVADEAFWRSTAPRLAGLTAAVINAGVVGAERVDAMSFAEWRRIMASNLDGAFLTLRAAVRAISGAGAIVAVASATALAAQARTSAYAESKAAVIQLVRVAAQENAARGLRINAIAPGAVDTPLWDGLPAFSDRASAVGRSAAMAERAAVSTPLARFAAASEVAEQIAFLLSDAAAFMTGSVMTCDGGYSL